MFAETSKAEHYVTKHQGTDCWLAKAAEGVNTPSIGILLLHTQLPSSQPCPVDAFMMTTRLRGHDRYPFQLRYARGLETELNPSWEI